MKWFQMRVIMFAFKTSPFICCKGKHWRVSRLKDICLALDSDSEQEQEPALK